MKYQIKESQQNVAITVSDVIPENQIKVLEALQECAEGRCSCPTNQYEKVDSLNVAQGADAVNVVMKLKSGQKIDRAEIETCLNYTIEKASNG